MAFFEVKGREKNEKEQLETFNKFRINLEQRFCYASFCYRKGCRN